MQVKCNKTNYFGYKREEKQNPFIGIMSFQHFRGDPIYSDCVVEPKTISAKQSIMNAILFRIT